MVSTVSDELGTTTSRKACVSCFGEYSGDITVCPEDGATLTLLSDKSLVGTILDDRYEILDVIGSGGMGMVYRAKQRFINRMVAVKVLHKGSITGTEIIKRFQQEAQAASALTSPHVVTVYDSNVSRNGEPYLVMDLLDGDSLESLLEKERLLPPGRAVDIFLQVCDALAKAHSKNIVHRDIKPSNIVLIEEDGQTDFVKVVDFGIAKILRDSESGATQLTRTGEVFGSPMYMSPEQWRGTSVDSRTDIYSLGAVMYKTLTGVPLFDTSDILQLAYKQAHELPASITSLGVRLPDGLEAIVFKALAKDATERFQSISEMVPALTSIRDDLKAKPKAAKVSEDTQSWLRQLTPPNQKNVVVDHTVEISPTPEMVASLPTQGPSQIPTQISTSTSTSVPSTLSDSGDSRPSEVEKIQAAQRPSLGKHWKLVSFSLVFAAVVGGAAFYYGEQSKLPQVPQVPANQTTAPSVGSSNSLVEPTSPTSPSSPPTSSTPSTSTSNPSPKPGNTSTSVHPIRTTTASSTKLEEHATTHRVQRHTHASHSAGPTKWLKKIWRKAI